MDQATKKIFIFITKGNMGGAQRYVFDLSCSLPPNQFDVFVVCGAGQTLKTQLEKHKIKTIEWPELNRDLSPLKDLKIIFKLIKFLKQHQPDIIHLNSSKIGFFGVIAGRLVGIKKIIFTAHGWVFNENRPYLSRLIFKFLQWLTVIASHQTIAVSQKTKKDMTNWPLTKKKIKVIYNGLDQFETLSKELAQNYLIKKTNLSAKNKTTIWLGTLAELHPNKGLDLAIKTIARIPQVIFLIIGTGKDKLLLEKLIEKNNLTDRVFLLGFLPEARQYLKAFDIFILPSRTEALPYTILEAGLAELPIIATKVGGLPEIVDHQTNGILVEPENIDELKKAIEELMTNPDLSQKLGQNLSVKISKDFSLNQMIKKTSALYQP